RHDQFVDPVPKRAGVEGLWRELEQIATGLKIRVVLPAHRHVLAGAASERVPEEPVRRKRLTNVTRGVLRDDHAARPLLDPPAYACRGHRQVVPYSRDGHRRLVDSLGDEEDAPLD